MSKQTRPPEGMDECILILHWPRGGVGTIVATGRAIENGEDNFEVGDIEAYDEELFDQLKKSRELVFVWRAVGANLVEARPTQLISEQ